MTDAPLPEDERKLDRWLNAQVNKLHQNLDAVLDIDAGLRDTELHQRQTGLNHQLDVVLDVDAGLESIVGRSPQPRPSFGDSGRSRNRMTPSAERPSSALKTYAERLMAGAPRERLAARTRISVAGLRKMRRTAVDVKRAANVARDRLPYKLDFVGDHVVRDFDVVRDLVVDVVRDRGIIGERDLVDLISALESARGLARELTLIRDVRRHVRALDLVRDLVQNLDRVSLFDHVLDHVPGDALDSIRLLYRTLEGVRAVDRALERVRALADYIEPSEAELSGALKQDISQFSEIPSLKDFATEFALALAESFEAIERAVTDFSDVDLSDIHLDGMSLQGLRWSDSTRWPRGWEGAIRQASVELKPGLYEVRGGSQSTDRTTAWLSQ